MLDLRLQIEMDREKVIDKYNRCFSIYRYSSNEEILKKLKIVEEFLMNGLYEPAEKVLSTFDDKDTLYRKLFHKLKGKPIYNTLKKIMKLKIDNPALLLKGLFSLGTHVCIEIEHGNLEYIPLIEDIFDKMHKVYMEVIR